MATHQLKAMIREARGRKVKGPRKMGNIPAVLYGGAVQTSLSLFVNEKELLRTYRMAGESALVTLALDGDTSYSVLIHDVARHPVSGAIQHVDFKAVRMDEKIRTTVPLVCIGEAPGVKHEGGNLVRALQEIEIECLPKDLPHEISVDISTLAHIRDSLRVRDLAVPSGVTLRADADETVVLVAEPAKEEAPTEAPTGDEQAAISAIKTEGEEKREKKAAEKETKEEK
ncbi:MAG: 50S ribosomal protein L25 [bacterium]|nr:50S ribosomal protein L25 [bacterium]